MLMQLDWGMMRIASRTYLLYHRPAHAATHPYLYRHLALRTALIRHSDLEGRVRRAVSSRGGRPGQQTGRGESCLRRARRQGEEHRGTLRIRGLELVEEALTLEGLQPEGGQQGLHHRGLVVWWWDNEWESEGVSE